jgi:hypothetical protein
MTDKDAMKLALEALESCTPQDTSTGHVIYAWHDEELVNGAIAVLEELLAQPEQESVYHLRQYGDVTKEQLDRYIETGDINPPAQPPQCTEQEPVAWALDYDIESVLSGFSTSLTGTAMRIESAFPKHRVKLLYTIPPQRIEQEPVSVELPCCGYTDASAVKWNPFNGVVQCHNCGQTYTPPQRTEQNFCSRCGKRTNGIHTCTPPKENT